MSELIVPQCRCVSNVRVYGFDESVKRAKYPLSVSPSSESVALTDGIIALAKSQAGSGHDQWLTGVIVQFDLTFSSKAWVEVERYHFFDFVSSQSAMHRITKFDLDNSYNDYVDERIIEIVKDKVSKYNALDDKSSEDAKKLYLEILYSNPAGFELTAGMTTNYRQLKTVYAQRKDHRLPEWREFCRWIEWLPHSGLITGKHDGR